MRIRLKNSGEVFHVWAQQNQFEGRAANVFFRDRSIFSYGEHFEMARFVTSEIVLFTTRSYSQTTAKHMSGVRRAISHKTAFAVPSFEDHNKNGLYLVQKVKNQIEKLQRSRTHIVWLNGEIQLAINAAHEYLKAFKKEIKIEIRKEISGLDAYHNKHITPELLKSKIDKENEYKAKEGERQKARDIRAAEHRRIMFLEESERLALWQEGKYSGSFSYNAPTLLRIKGQEIETTKGASVPLIEARKFWNTLGRKENVIGMRLGHYTVDGLEGSTLTVGCHKIPLREVYRMAKALNWDNGLTLEVTQ